ncbi:uncharacterized protein LOC143195688 [Rhynchophorus ferrugineus]|uniref:uncharacterized protein LOC143195688 n=1 Tax=Rhynchophorus ferrugineus TaxID=354439 RepID=UPI003FCD05D3
MDQVSVMHHMNKLIIAITGDCGNRIECARVTDTPPTTLIETILKRYGGFDYYHILLVDGYNTMAFTKAVNGNSDGGE